MLKIGRIYLDYCGYRDGVFEELLIKSLDKMDQPTHQLIHAPNGVGKTTILALLFGTFEPDRRKFLRTEINRQHKIEHYFLPGRLGVVAVELVKEGANKAPVRHIIGQVFWLTPASKGDEGEPGQRRFFSFEASDDLGLDTMPFRGLGGRPVLRALDDFTRWAREMRNRHPGIFFSTDAAGPWRRHLVAELGIDLRVIEIQRRFCAAEGGIGAAFLDFRTEQQFLEKVLSFMIPADAAESVVQALSSGLAKIRDLPRRRDQLKGLTRLADAFEPFFKSAADLEATEAEHSQDLKRLGRLYARLKTEITKLEVERATVQGEMAIASHNLESARTLERVLAGEILFLEKTAADRRINDAKSWLEKARSARDAADRGLRAARAAFVDRRFGSAKRVQDGLEAELARIERDLAPDRARLERAGASLHALLDRMASEADGDAEACEGAAAAAYGQAEIHGQLARAATTRRHERDLEISHLNKRLTEHTSERRQLESSGIVHAMEPIDAAVRRLKDELTKQEDVATEFDLRDEALQGEAMMVEGARQGSEVEVLGAEADSRRLDREIRAGRALEGQIMGHEFLPVILAGESKDPYRIDLLERVRAARASREEAYRQLANERNGIAGELAFLDAEGVSVVPDDVGAVAGLLKESGFPGAQPAEHYLAIFKPEADMAMALVRQDPARFTGVFVANADKEKLAALAAENRLKLKGPVLVSEATLDPTRVADDSPGVVFGPFSAARFNTHAAEEEKLRLTSMIQRKDDEIAELRRQVDALQSLIDDIQLLHATYAHRRPDELVQDKEEVDRKCSEARGRGRTATARLSAIQTERGQIKENRMLVGTLVAKLRLWRRDAERFMASHSSIADVIARLPAAEAERAQKERETNAAEAAAKEARDTASKQEKKAVGLRGKAAAWRGDKRHYPETDGKPASPIGSTLDDLIQGYKTAEQMLTSKRGAQQAHVAQRLSVARQEVAKLTEELKDAMTDLTAADLTQFADVVDLERAIAESDARAQECRERFTQAEGMVNVAEAKSGPVIRKIGEAEQKYGLKLVVVPECVGATVEACEVERDAREVRRETSEREIKTLTTALSRLDAREVEIKNVLELTNGLATRAEDHLPELYRTELPDLSIEVAELKPNLSQLIERLNKLHAKVEELRRSAEESFEAVHRIFSAETFRQLEPQVAENLRPYVARSAGIERKMLQSRLAERIAVVQSEIENQQRDQNVCLEQLRQHVIHADDLLRRATRCSKIPKHVSSHGGERILKIKRMLRDLSPDIVRHQLSVWLDEQASTGRVPQDGAVLAAELLGRIHGGRSLEIEILKPKRDAIDPYMRVDRMGFSGGEGVTVAMMLYTVIQKMAMDERADGKNAASGGFLILDNTYGMSNMLEHVVLQMTMAELLGIQLYVTTCSEDKHVLNMFPTITRLTQGERVLLNGVPQYIRVRAGDYLFKESGHAA